MPFSVIPPWTLEEARVDLILLKRGKAGQIGKSEVIKYVARICGEFVKIYTAASKTADNKVGIALVR